ncbi:MAG TPA: hypothetical protein VFJ12_07715 [Segeticoccus sp.]|nr:hypothetical protein [Segeticoccus sp.]
MTSPRLTRVALPAALLAAGLALTACGTADPGNAAVVDGEAISTATLQEATGQLSAAGATPETTLEVLVVGHFARQAASRMGQGVSTDQAKQYLTRQLHIKDPKPATVEVIRRALATQVVRQQMQQDPKVGQQFMKQLKNADITVNPRYGDYDPKTGNISQQPPNWIKTSSKSSSGSTTSGQ